jgi:flagellar protein FlaG
MGFSLTGTQVIFFIAAVIIASAVSGVFIVVVNDVTKSFSDRGDRVQEQLDTEFKIINDPDNIPSEGSNYLFYMKNIGGAKLITSNDTFQVFVDGDFVAIANYNFSDSSIQPGDVAALYIATNEISAGDHTLRVVGPRAIEDEFAFTI